MLIILPTVITPANDFVGVGWDDGVFTHLSIVAKSPFESDGHVFFMDECEIGTLRATLTVSQTLSILEFLMARVGFSIGGGCLLMSDN